MKNKIVPIIMTVISIIAIVLFTISPPSTWVTIIWVITANIWMWNASSWQRRHGELEQQFREYVKRETK